MDIKLSNNENLSNTGGGNGNGPGNTGGNTSGHNATTNSPDSVNQLNEAQIRFKWDMEVNNHHNMDVKQVQHEPVTQAEYEKVVKGARLTDPVEEPISRSCTNYIYSVCLQNDKPLFACRYHIHSVDDNNKETVRKECKCDCNKRDGYEECTKPSVRRFFDGFV